MLVLLLVSSAYAETLSGRVVDVSDGDTFTLQSNDGRVTVRLAEIDAPEGDQPYGVEARRMLAGLIGGQHVAVVVQAIDRYGRSVGRVYVDPIDDLDPIDVCREMVRRGGAWAYRRFLHDQELLELEQQARHAAVGLWADAAAVAPWEWRTHPSARHCAIKGNIGQRGERIYHVPGQRYYEATRINTAKGEHWFCSEAEARAAGWRRARQ